MILDTLAAAYAASGDFERATATAQEAASLAAAAGATALSGDIGGRLALYRQGEAVPRDARRRRDRR